MKKSRILALLKNDKPGDNANWTVAIVLLCVIYKLLERLILNRIGPYVDDIAISTQHKDIIQSEPDLLYEYFKSLRLCPSNNKTEVSYFHFSTNQANVELKVNVDVRLLHHNLFPKYLSITWTEPFHFENI